MRNLKCTMTNCTWCYKYYKGYTICNYKGDVEVTALANRKQLVYPALCCMSFVERGNNNVPELHPKRTKDGKYPGQIGYTK